MRTITLIIIHCSATRCTQNYSFDACRRDHIEHQKFTNIGLSFLHHQGRHRTRRSSVGRNGAHCLHHNKHSIGICYEGGLDASGKPADTRTAEQKQSMEELVQDL